MHFLAALDNPRMRSVLCLFEGVATGAADGWYRMKDKPASTLLHLGPGLANGLANIHNAKRAFSAWSTSWANTRSPTCAAAVLRHRRAGAALCHWVRRADSADTIAWDATQAVQVASEHPGKIATLILPGDVMARGDVGIDPASPPGHAQGARSGADRPYRPRAEIGRAGDDHPGQPGTRGRALELAGRVARATGARLGSQFFTARIERGVGRTPIERIPMLWRRRLSIRFPASDHGGNGRAGRLLLLSRQAQPDEKGRHASTRWPRRREQRAGV
jgi:acetolactate synthase-1/2/3 large subunit